MKSVEKVPMTFCVGESGVRSDGCASSMPRSSAMRASYSASLTVGASRT